MSSAVNKPSSVKMYQSLCRSIYRLTFVLFKHYHFDSFVLLEWLPSPALSSRFMTEEPSVWRRGDGSFPEPCHTVTHELLPLSLRTLQTSLQMRCILIRNPLYSNYTFSLHTNENTAYSVILAGKIGLISPHKTGKISWFCFIFTLVLTAQIQSASRQWML